MRGNFHESSVAEVIAHIYLSKFNGVLRLTNQEVRKNIYFVEGSIVFAHSNLRLDRLGETLLRLGKISDEEFQIASQEVISKGKRLGQVLWEKGYLSPGEVSSGVHYQLQQIVYSVFNWEQGTFEFEEKERPVFEDIMLDVSTPNLLLDGIRNCTNSIILTRSYNNNEDQVVFLQEGTTKIRAELEYAEETILACVDGSKTIRMLKNLARLVPLEFERAMCSLLVCGLVELRAPDSAGAAPEAAGPSEEDSSFKRWSTLSTQPMQARLKTLSDEEMRKMIVQTGEKFRNATDEEVLKILPGCTKEEVQRAYDHLVSMYQPLFFAPDRYVDLKGTLRLILDRSTSAFQSITSQLDDRVELSHTPAPASPAEAPASDLKEEEDIPDLQERLRKDPTNVMWLQKLGKKMQQIGKALEAEKHFLRALEVEPQNVEHHFALADLYNGLGLKIKAFKHLNIILQMQPENERAMDALGLKKRKKALYDISSNE
jgi:hypothetical protein